MGNTARMTKKVRISNSVFFNNFPHIVFYAYRNKGISFLIVCLKYCKKIKIPVSDREWKDKEDLCHESKRHRNKLHHR